MSRPNSRQSIDPEFMAVLANLGEGTSWETFASEQRAMLMANEEHMKENARLKALEEDEAFAKQLSTELNAQASPVVRPRAQRRGIRVEETVLETNEEDEDEDVDVTDIEFDDISSNATLDTEESDRDEMNPDSEDIEQESEHFYSAGEGSDSRDEDEEDSYEGLMSLAAHLGDIPRRPKTSVESLPTRQYHSPHHDANRSTSSECVICLTQFHNNATLRRLPCLHEFHVKCIDKWLSSNNVCPICRLEL